MILPEVARFFLQPANIIQSSEFQSPESWNLRVQNLSISFAKTNLYCTFVTREKNALLYRPPQHGASLRQQIRRLITSLSKKT